MKHDFGYFEEKQLGKPYDLKLLKRLYPYSRPFRLWLLCSILLVILITLLELAIPYVTKIAIDRYIVPQANGLTAAPADAPAARASQERNRYLRLDLSDPEVKAVVQKYGDRFDIVGGEALVPYAELDRLAPKDLARLRESDLAGVTLMAGLFLAIVLVNFGLNFGQVVIMEFTGQMMMHDLRVHLYQHIQDLSASFFNRNPVGRLVTRVTNDIQNMYELFTSIIALVFKDLFLLTGITVVMLSIQWKLALATFSVLPLVLLASIYFAGRARAVFRILRIKVAEINTKFSETIQGIRVVQLFKQERRNYQAFKSLNHANYEAGMQQIRLLAVFMPVIELLAAAAVAIVIYYGGRGVLAEHISLGALVAFISYIRMFFRPIRDIAEKYNIMQNAMASAERIFLILDSDDRLPEPPDRQALGKPPRLGLIQEIVFDGVSFGYLPGETVLKNIRLRIQSGETVAVVGPTGSGKTSLINLITRFYDPTAGRILINGLDIRQIGSERLRSKMALVTQDPFLFSSTIRDNILHGNADLNETELARLLEAANCQPLISRLEGGVDTILSEGGSSISSGERQLLSIARAFAKDPDLIILDEATSYIDSDTEQRIQEALQNLMHNRTSIVIAHRLSSARNADRILVLKQGEIIESGNHAELLQCNGFYSRLHQLQNQPAI